MNDPTFKFEPSFFSDHTVSKPNLSELVVEEDGNIEGEGWDSEMWERNLSSSKSNVKEWNVEEDCDKCGLEEESEVTEHVDHTLLGEGKVSGLANHEIGPLDAYNRYEITGLGELQSFGGVTNWVFTDISCFVETGEGLVIGIPSAFSPGLRSSVDCVEESDINFSVLRLVPSELAPVVFFLPFQIFLFSGSWVNSSDVGISVESIVVSVIGVCVLNTNWGTVVTNHAIIINIPPMWEWSLQGSESPDFSWSDSEVVETQEVSVHTG